MTDILLIRINCPGDEVAAHIGETLLAERLAGCVNVDGPIASMYWWEGRIEKDEEWVLWVKAPADNWSDIEAKILQLHPDDTPAIIATPCVQVNSGYAQWLNRVVSG